MENKKSPVEREIELLDQRVQEHWTYYLRTLEDMNKRLTEIEGMVGNRKDLIESVGLANGEIYMLKDHVIKSNKLIKEHYDELNRICLRVIKLEKYFDDDKFHHVLDELSNLEKEYSKKAAELVEKIVKKNIKKRKS
jgi:hypothetical protein